MHIYIFSSIVKLSRLIFLNIFSIINSIALCIVNFMKINYNVVTSLLVEYMTSCPNSLRTFMIYFSIRQIVNKAMSISYFK